MTHPVQHLLVFKGSDAEVRAALAPLIGARAAGALDLAVMGPDPVDVLLGPNAVAAGGTEVRNFILKDIIRWDAWRAEYWANESGPFTATLQRNDKGDVALLFDSVLPAEKLVTSMIGQKRDLAVEAVAYDTVGGKAWNFMLPTPDVLQMIPLSDPEHIDDARAVIARRGGEPAHPDDNDRLGM